MIRNEDYEASAPPPSYDTSTAAHLLKQLLGFFNEGLITKDVWEEKQREILSPLVVGTPVVNTNHTLSKGLYIAFLPTIDLIKCLTIQLENFP